MAFDGWIFPASWMEVRYGILNLKILCQGTNRKVQPADAPPFRFGRLGTGSEGNADWKPFYHRVNLPGPTETPKSLGSLKATATRNKAAQQG